MLMASTATLLGQVCGKISHLRSETASDKVLLSQFVQSRSEAAFEELIRRHGPLVWGICRRMLNQHSDAEDAFQAVWMVLARKAGLIHRPERLVQWLYGVTRHAALNVRKIKLRRERREQSWGESIDVADPIQPVWNDLRPVIDDEIARLSAKYQLPVLLCCVQGKSHRDAAEELAWPIGTVAGRLSRGREILRERLLKRGIEVSPAILAVVLSQSMLAGELPPALLISTMNTVFAGSMVGIAGTSLSPTLAKVIHGTLKDLFFVRCLSLGCIALGVLTVCLPAGLCWWGLPINRNTPAETGITNVATASVIQPRTIALPVDPQAIILRWRQIDTQGERPDTELSISANGKVIGVWYDSALESMISCQTQFSDKDLQDIMQFAVHDQQALQIDVKGTWKQLLKDYEFNGDQRAPADTLLTEMEIRTADKAHQFCWYQLSSSEVWFHEVPTVRHAAELHRRMKNLLLIMQAGGTAKVDRIASLLYQSLRTTYPRLVPFQASDLSNVTFNSETDLPQWTFSQRSKFDKTHYFSATCEESSNGLQLVSVTPGPIIKSPTMKRRETSSPVR